jgi:hypothetical protein
LSNIGEQVSASLDDGSRGVGQTEYGTQTVKYDDLWLSGSNPNESILDRDELEA